MPPDGNYCTIGSAICNFRQKSLSPADHQSDALQGAQNKGAADQTKQFSRCFTPCLNDVYGGHIWLFGVPINELIFDFSKSEVRVANVVKWTSSKLKPAVVIATEGTTLQ
jgi:hypothetical protein